MIIIGAGASGLLCAAMAAQGGLSVQLVERMERSGSKLRITGKGRCNLTNNCTPEEFFAAVRTNARFLYGAYSKFSAQDTMALFESLGVPLKTERGNRVFPASDRAQEIVEALVQYAARAGVQFCLQTPVRSLWLEEGALRGIVTAAGQLPAKQVVVATGGKSYPKTGSRGDGYYFAKQAGHTLLPPRGSLVPVVTREDWCKEAMGLSLRNVTLTLRKTGKNKPVFSEMGEMLFAHFGISGPLVLSASAHMAEALSNYRLEIDLKPALTPQQLDARILRDFAEYANRDFANALEALLPRTLIPVIVRQSGIPPGTKVHQVTKAQRGRLCELLKALPLTPVALRPVEEAVVTAGGVKTAEIDPRTMQSKKVPGLYFIGEVLDLDAYTGGFNLQIAFTTAAACASALVAAQNSHV